MKMVVMDLHIMEFLRAISMYRFHLLGLSHLPQREADFYDAFSQVVEQIKQIKPDFIIHTGDLFHRSSPSNRAITYALQKFKEINSLNIPFIVIS